MTIDLVTSKEYDALYDLPFEERHTDANAEKYGVWRWRGMREHRDTILKIILQPDKKVIDFGGALAPLGFGSTIVDQAPVDIFGNKTLTTLPERFDAFFSSHTLEHLQDPVGFMHNRVWPGLSDGGYVILHLPSVYWYRWHPDFKSTHHWIFILDGNRDDAVIERTRIQPALRLVDGHEWYLNGGASYCGDDSIMIIAWKES